MAGADVKPGATMTREQVLGFRVRAQQLDRAAGVATDAAVLDLGVQDSGPDGGLWALALRGVDVGGLGADELVTTWTVRGAPHRYRRADLPSVAAAVEPFSEADAGKRIYDAAKPLKAAGIAVLDALDAVAAAMRAVVTRPTAKGEVSARLAETMDPPYLRFCRPCDATHLFEMPFRLAALRGGLELQPGTSPPVLQRIAGFTRARVASPDHDVVRAYLRRLGPATHQQVAAYLDAPVADVRRRWPEDAVQVVVGDDDGGGGGGDAWLLADDEAALGEPPPAATALLGPFDLFLQARDRSLLVPDAARAKALWPALGRPGAVLHGGDLVGLWRPRSSGGRLTVRVEPWARLSGAARQAVAEQAERLAAHRGVRLAGVDIAP